MKTPTLIALILILSGCASSAVKVSNAKEIPPERVLYRPTPKNSNPAKVNIIRDSGFVAGKTAFLFRINGKDIANFEQEEKLELNLDQGTYVFGVRGTSSTDSPREIETSIKGGDNVYYRLSIGDMNNPYPFVQRSAEAE